MLKRTIVTAAATFCLLGAPAIAQPLSPQNIVDNHGFKQPVVAYTIGVPQGWKMQGGVKYNIHSQCTVDQRQTHLQMTSANGQRIVGYPSEGWNWTSMLDQDPSLAQYGAAGPCRASRTTDAQAYLKEFIGRQYGGAQIISVKARPDLAAEVRKDAAKYIPPGQQVHIEGAEAVINAGGRSISLITSTIAMRMPASDMYGGMNGYIQTVVTGGVMAHTGTTDSSLVTRIAKSMEIEPQYERRLMEHQRKMNEIAARGARQRATSSNQAQAKLNQTYNEISDITAATGRNVSAMNDAGHSRTTDMLLEQTPYTNTYGEQVYAPQGYDSVYQMQDGSYYGTNNPNANPYAETGMWGEQLEEYQY